MLASRNAEFSGGMQGNGPVASSLAVDSANYNALVPKGMTISSVLQNYLSSPNGMSAADAGRRLPGGRMMPTPNGSSSSTYAMRFPTGIETKIGI